MNWDQIEGKWKHFTGSAQERWGKLTDDDWKADRRQERSAGRADSGAIWTRQGGSRKAG